MENYCDIATDQEIVFSTGIDEIDGIFSSQGGIVSGRIYFLTGMPGTGKTTLSIKIQARCGIKTGLYSRESSAEAVASQTKRLEIGHKRAFISDIDNNETLESFLESVDKKNIQLIILDSIQEIALDYMEKGVSEESAIKIIFGVIADWIKKNKKQCSAIIIGHVTKDGDYKGASYLLHKSDAHIKLVADGAKMYVTCGKNRLGGSGSAFYSFIDSPEAIKFDAPIVDNIVTTLQGAIKVHLARIKKNKKMSDAYKEICKNEKALFEDDEISSIDYLLELIKVIHRICPEA
jgi:predicted ATP-dependent serine protease